MILLPDPDDRMTPLRKEAIIHALRRREIERPEILARYDLSEDELASWEQRYARLGLEGLGVCKLQVLR